MTDLLDRFLRYVRVSTQADEKSTTYPSTPGQLELGRMLAGELRALGLRDASQDEHGIVLATIPATVQHDAPVIAWIAHVDTSPETSGIGVKPIVHANYDGQDIVLPGDPSKVLRVKPTIPELAALKGKTIITTDGTTLLGGDDKAGVAVIMEAAAQLMAQPEIPHGPIRICFTCDEEIGHGVDHVDLAEARRRRRLHARRRRQGEIDGETFSADLAVVTITGVNIHPVDRQGTHDQRRAAGRTVPGSAAAADPVAGNDRRAARVSCIPTASKAAWPRSTLRILLRDFETAKLAEQSGAAADSGRGRCMAEYPAGAHRCGGHAAVSQHGRRPGQGAARPEVRRGGDARRPGSSRN